MCVILCVSVTCAVQVQGANIPEWREKLDKQRGAVLATEIRNNSFKMAKWTMGAILGGADFIKFGYVSRVNPKDSTQHTILGVQQFQPQELAKQMTLNVNNAWGVLRVIIERCLKMPPGKYLIMKDANRVSEVACSCLFTRVGLTVWGVVTKCDL